MINPVFVEREGMQLEEEGCLSVPGFNATVVRPARAVVRGLDRSGTEQTIEGRELLARAFQHEMDHLDGTALRRSPARDQEGSDRPQNPQAESARANGRRAPLRIVYFGTPGFCGADARALLDSRHQRRRRSCRSRIARKDAGQHVAADADESSWRSKPVCRFCNRASFATRHFWPTLAGYDADLGVVAAYGRILPDALLAVPRLGMINVHASLLPKYRGAAPIHRAVMAGDEVTGVTIMRVVAELDAGPMLATVDAADRWRRDEHRCRARPGGNWRALHCSTSSSSSREDRSRKRRRTTALATYAPKLEKSEGPIDWSLPAARHPQPRPRASTLADGLDDRLAGNRCLVHRTAVAGPVADARPAWLWRRAAMCWPSPPVIRRCFSS